jgi:hypothetical protein
MAAEEYKIGLTVDTKQAQAAVAGLDRSLNTLSGSAKKFSAGSAQATNALSNLSRVAQDAPFGFIGIANNLNPLLESFQRLKVETGGTKSALKALGASLTGPAGLGLALGVVSSLLVTFGDEILKGSANLYDAKKAADEYTNALSQAQGKAQAEIATVNALVKVVQDETLSREHRNNALKQLQAEYPAYFGNLDLDKAKTGELEKSYNSLSQAIARKAELQALENLLAEEYSKKAKLQAEGVSKNITLSDKFFAILKGGGNAGITAAKLLTSAIDNYGTALTENQKNIDSYNTRIQELTKVDTKNTQQTKTGTVATQARTVATKEQTKANYDLYKSANAIADAAAAGYADMFTTTLTNGQATVNTDEMRAMAVEQQQIMLASGRVFQARSAMIAAASDMVKKKFEEQQAAAAALKMQLIETAFNGFENLINVATSAEASFDLIKKALFDMIKQLALAVAKALIFKAVMGAVSGGATVVGGAVGGGFLGKIFGFATGGIVTGPTAAMIGEGTEAEAVLPLSQLDALLSNSGGNMPYVLSTSIRGADLQLVMRRADQQGRFTGNTF